MQTEKLSQRTVKPKTSNPPKKKERKKKKKHAYFVSAAHATSGYISDMLDVTCISFMKLVIFNACIKVFCFIVFN